MKSYAALSVVAPAGDRIRSGLKTLEIRSWRPDALPLRDLLIVQNNVRLSREGITEDPGGKIVAMIDIESVEEWREEELAASCARKWEPGWLAWRITNVRPVDYPDEVPARLRIYHLSLRSADLPPTTDP